MSAISLLGLARAEFDYEAREAEEVSIKEGDVLYIIEDDDAEWWKIRAKVSPSSDEPEGATGLVPASYLEPMQPISRAIATYAYQATNEEELTVVDDEPLNVYEDDGEWTLVGRVDESGQRGVGYMPTSYLTITDETVSPVAAHEEDEVYEEAEENAPIAIASAPSVPALARNGATKTPVKIWSVSELDGKKKKKKGSLGIGNGALFFASESDKAPVQQRSIVDLQTWDTEKSKQIKIQFADDIELIFSTSKDALEEIVQKLEAELEAHTGATPRQNTTNTPVPAPPPIAALGPAPPPPKAPSPPPEEHYSAPVPPPRPQAVRSLSEKTGVALYDFSGEGDDELSIQEGDQLVILDDSSNEEWWKVRKAEDGSEGVVPASYVGTEDEHQQQQAQEQDEEDTAAPLVAQSRSDPSAARREQERSDARRARQLAEEEAAAEDQRRKQKSEARRRREMDNSRSGAAPPNAAPRPSSSSGTSERKPAADQTRIWKDRTGQFKVEAQFLGLNNGKIRLHKLNGVIIEVPVAKMSPDDIQFLQSITKRSSKDGEDDIALAKLRSARPSSGSQRPSTSSRRSDPATPSRSKPARKATMDWFGFFLEAGCSVDDCTRYANNFERDRMDENVLPDLEPATMRSLGLREGDVIRVSRLIKQRFAAPNVPNKPDTDTDQLAEDEAMARKLQEQENAGSTAGGSLFTSASGGLKTTRRGRPPVGRSAPSIASISDSIASASSQLSAAVPARPTSANEIETRPSRSASNATSSGFDDDAWTVKPSSKPSTPAPPPPPAPTAPAQAVVKPASPAPAPTPATRPEVERAPSSTQDYNERLLAQLGIGSQQNQRPAHQPPPVINGPRGPLAPVAANGPLLAPLVPTNTGINRFVPTRPGAQPGLAPQQTGFAQPGPQLYAQPTGMNAQLYPQQTGFQQPQQSFQQPQQLYPQQTGYQQPMQTGLYPQQGQLQQMGMMQPQQTGYQSPAPALQQPPQQTGFGQQAPIPSLSTFGPQNGASSAGQSTGSTQYQPSNVFASMKAGTFGNKSSQLGPQSEQKYDVLRAQPTGYNGGMMPQQTGFQQPQMTGFQPQLTPQMTGYAPQQQQMFGQAQQQQQQQPYWR
ncbi:uncharacterized protein L969DRAFT_93884 [Mixia osmundae IAM 14324]|uniref:Actin cytoskeleton-regulatory complex protein SLA1 n=1 Tax=Mixia osmundae (strain CBS 9802 / IAM 14324 / JCM 22182 / KY 12970) TaxID=764103 RepID=G7E9V4_MIXOS|nr:uncharacterized protein L969DRAFT_93884 [Mixia osmundae IAM 14324]KEI40055.1 hypothetical protein L969DRAFT_93884 [Mixia osmundae IAM 14324]GAA99423.1 hypothetical protein E5Q_06121 [Mixia osmundae IAM 14324]